MLTLTALQNTNCAFSLPAGLPYISISKISQVQIDFSLPSSPHPFSLQRPPQLLPFSWCCQDSKPSMFSLTFSILSDARFSGFHLYLVPQIPLVSTSHSFPRSDLYFLTSRPFQSLPNWSSSTLMRNWWFSIKHRMRSKHFNLDFKEKSFTFGSLNFFSALYSTLLPYSWCSPRTSPALSCLNSPAQVFWWQCPSRNVC